MNRVIRNRLRRAVIVTTKPGPTFRGVLFQADREALVLRNAEMVDTNMPGPIPVDGELVLVWAEVAFLQFT